MTYLDKENGMLMEGTDAHEHYQHVIESNRPPLKLILLAEWWDCMRQCKSTVGSATSQDNLPKKDNSDLQSQQENTETFAAAAKPTCCFSEKKKKYTLFNNITLAAMFFAEEPSTSPPARILWACVTNVSKSLCRKNADNRKAIESQVVNAVDCVIFQMQT